MGTSLSPEALDFAQLAWMRGIKFLYGPITFEFERVRCYVSRKSRMSFVTPLFLYSAATLLASTTCFADCAEKAVPDVERSVSRPKNMAQLLGNLKLPDQPMVMSIAVKAMTE
jgi:hypothetical protein